MQLLLSPVLASALLGSGSIIDLDITIVIQFVLFAVAYIVLKAVLFDPMVALFEAREKAIDGARVTARETEKEAEKRSKEFEEQLRRVRVSAGEERDRLRQEGQQLERAVLDRVRSDVQTIQTQASEQMASEARAIRSDFQTTVPNLARQIATKMLGREVH